MGAAPEMSSARPGALLRRSTLVRAIRGLVIAALILAAAGLINRKTGLMDRQFIFFPEREHAASPSDWGLDADDVTFTAPDGTSLHGWFVPGTGDVTLLWFHGNAGNISHRLDELSLIHDRLGVNVFIFDYHGYGRSEGRASEEGTYISGEAALGYLRNRSDVDPAKIVYFGRSLGGAVAVELATKHRPYGLVLVSPFTSIRSMARRHYPFLPLGPLIRTKYDSLSKLPEVGAPLLIVHGDNDEIVPIDEGRTLFEAAGEPKDFYTVRGADHNDTYYVGGEAYFNRLLTFIRDLDPSSAR